MKSLFHSKTQRWQKFLLVSGRLVGAHPDGQQHGVSKEVLKSVFTHVANSYENLLEQKKVFAWEKSLTSTELVWDTNMAAVSLFWDTKMAAVTSCENAL